MKFCLPETFGQVQKRLPKLTTFHDIHMTTYSPQKHCLLRPSPALDGDADEYEILDMSSEGLGSEDWV